MPLPAQNSPQNSDHLAGINSAEIEHPVPGMGNPHPGKSSYSRGRGAAVGLEELPSEPSLGQTKPLQGGGLAGPCSEKPMSL